MFIRTTLLFSCVMLGGCFGKAGFYKKSLSSEKSDELSHNSLIDSMAPQKFSSEARKKARVSEYQALENLSIGQTFFWEHIQTGERGEVFAAQPYQVGSQDCRQFVHTLFDHKGSNLFRGTACRQNGGQWVLLR